MFHSSIGQQVRKALYKENEDSVRSSPATRARIYGDRICVQDDAGVLGFNLEDQRAGELGERQRVQRRQRLAHQALVYGTGFRVYGLALGVWGLGFGVRGSGFKVWGFGCRDWGLALQVWGLGCHV